MADNITLNAGSGGATLATDDDGTAHHQYIKVEFGADNTFTKVTSSVGLPVGDAGGSLTVDAPVGTPVFVRLSDGSSAITTLPVSMAAVPTGASTAAKQPALGTAGTASSDVITVQGIASMTPLLATITFASAQAVTQSGTWNIATVTTVTTVSTVTSLSQWAGNAIDTNSGSKSAGTLRVVLATDQPQLTNKLLVTPDANSAVNVAQVGGSSVSTAATGVQKVGIVGNAGATVDSTVGAGTAPANQVVVGSVYSSSAPAPTTGQAMAQQADQSGNLRTFPGMGFAALSVWNSGTSLNATQAIYSNSGAPAVLVHLVQSSGSFSAGAITFEVTYDNSNWVTISADAVIDPTSTSLAQTSLPYTLTTSTNKGFLLLTKGAQGLRIKLSTAITGTGTVTPNYALLAHPPVQQATLGSSTATIGALVANQSVNLNQVASSSIATGHGTASGAIRVELPTDGTGVVNAAQSGTWTVQPGNTANSTPWLVTDTPATSGGLSSSTTISTGATNQDATVVKASQGQVYGYALFNTTASARYVKFYNLASGATSASTPFLRVYVPPTGGANVDIPKGIACGTGIMIRITTGAADNDTGACSTNDVLANVFYK